LSEGWNRDVLDGIRDDVVNICDLRIGCEAYNCALVGFDIHEQLGRLNLRVVLDKVEHLDHKSTSMGRLGRIEQQGLRGLSPGDEGR